ncbi:MAG: tRNA (adenosine(37)-N6)-threonylcarbamoyltransferase complex dimerization subunit type 1 TsaB [Gammaproteobacteria bacterium]
MNASILAIEASSETCSIALQHHDKTYQRSTDIPRGHAKHILPMIQDTLAEADCPTNQLDVIAVTNGPGAFTSVRIGVAVCQGLASALRCPVISVSSLAVMAYQALTESGCRSALVALDARMDEVYFGAYSLDSDGLPEPLQPDCVSKPEQLELAHHDALDSLCVTGMGWDAYAIEMTTRFSDYDYQRLAFQFPSAVSLLAIAEQKYQAGAYHDVTELIPVYLRDQVVHS